MTNKEILKTAIATYGADLQVMVAIEEMAELTQAISKLKRVKAKDTSMEAYEELVLNIAEEIADVKIMLEQLELIFGCDNDVELYQKAKIMRLEKNLGINVTKIKIRMLVNYDDMTLPFAKSHTKLLKGNVYEALANENGIINVICNDETLVELPYCCFKIIDAPLWVRNIHKRNSF